MSTWILRFKTSNRRSVNDGYATGFPLVTEEPKDSNNDIRAYGSKVKASKEGQCRRCGY